MKETARINLRDIFLIPNLMSLMRVVLTPFIGYFLWIGTDRGNEICVGFLALAGLTDLLDGFLARKLNQITPLGIVLDPIADKLFAIVLIIELISFRAFPIWLAAAIIGRDLLIMAGGMVLLREKELILPSNLTGKYYFSSLSALILSYVVSFPFGKVMFLGLTAALLVISIINYGRIFLIMSKGAPRPEFKDKPQYKFARSVLTIIIMVIVLFKFYGEVVVRYLK